MSHKENQIPFLYRRDILDNNQCLEIVKEFWKNKNLHKNVNTSNKVSTDLQCKFSEKNTRILLSKSINYISDALTIAINDYTKLYPQTKKLYLDWGLYDNFNLQFYQPHQGFGDYHCENLGKDYSDSNTRFLVWTIYLSNTLDGGTEFLHQNHIEKCKMGKVIIFPADWTFTHRSQISTTHCKLIATGWLNYKL